MNSFVALRRQEMEEFRGTRQEAVRKKVEQQLRAADFVGEVVQLFFPVLSDTLTVLAGGEPSYPEEEALFILREADDDDPFGAVDDDTDDRPPAGPGPTDEVVR